MKMEYFTDKGVKSVVEKYRNLLDKEFRFDLTETKHKLTDIIEGKSICTGGFLILFHSDNQVFCTIDKFMKINKIEYTFNDYDRTSVEI